MGPTSAAAKRAAWPAQLFRWLPVPLWCYFLPMLATSLGWLPADPSARASYQAVASLALPFALFMLLASVDLASLARMSGPALLAAGAGAFGIMAGAASGAWLLRDALPEGAWSGAGSLAGTWTGGTMNLLSLRAIFETPDAVFAPLVIVDAIVAYGWMALLAAASGSAPAVDRWLRASPFRDDARHATVSRRISGRSIAAWCVFAAGAVIAARRLALSLPVTPLVSSASGWTMLLITTAALFLSLDSRLRRFASGSTGIGTGALYVVLAATGAQAQFTALLETPAWLAFGGWVVLVHGVTLLAVGRVYRLPLGLLATASQANIGGVVSAPLVGAVYQKSLAPVGLVLAMAGNALGTYFGLMTATLAKWLVG